MMQLLVLNQYQDAVEIEIAGTETVFDLKKKIAAKTYGLMVSDQILKFNTKTLNDTDTIQVAGVHHNAVLEMSLRNGFNIFIKTDSNAIHEINVFNSNTVAVVKSILNRLLRIPVDQQQLVYNGEELRNDDILIEKAIAPGVTINLVEMKLSFQLNTGQEASSSKTTGDHNIANLANINLGQTDIEIKIQASAVGRKNPLALRVLSVDTVRSVKDKIHADTKINRNVQQLYWKGKLLNDNVVLETEKICDGSTLCLVALEDRFKVKIQIGPEERISMAVLSTETVFQLKVKLQMVTEIPVSQQILYLDNKKLEPDTFKLVNCGIREQSDIALTRIDSFDIHINTLTGKTITVRVHKNDRISNLRKEIDRRLGIRPGEQQLIYYGKELQDESFDAINIKAGVTIHLSQKLIGGFKLM